jgi:NNP family nitrate/nitrite transporter-like MFS transporter
MIVTAALTGLFVYAMPLLSIPVLFPEISADLSLSIVQVGVIWGVGSLTGVVMALMGGLLGDRFGTRRILITTCLLSGVLGASRGFSGTFVAFVATSLLFGLVQPIIPTNLHKIAGAWFPRRQLGLATGIISAGFATGLMLGSLLSASVISPALGGWQGVLYLYGLLAIVMAGVWFVVHPKKGPGSAPEKGSAVPFRASLSHVARIRNIWIVGLGAMGFWACARGFIGYLPTYLRDIGWSPNRADQALTLFFVASLLAAIPFSMLTDRYRLRREYLIFASLMMAAGVGLMTFAEGFFVLIAVLIAGVVFDGFMAILQATVLEIPGVGLIFAGTALGLAAMMREVGGAYSPPIGNSLTAFGANAPFLFWSLMALLGAIAFVVFLKRGHGQVRSVA